MVFISLLSPSSLPKPKQGNSLCRAALYLRRTNFACKIEKIMAFSLGMTDGVDDGVEGRRRLECEGRNLRHDGREHVGAQEDAKHGDHGVGSASEEPDGDVGDGHFGYPHLGRGGVFVLMA